LAPASAVLLAQSKAENNSSNVPSEGVEMTMIELSEAEIQALKEQNHRRIKRVVTIVAFTMMLISFVLVALSLSLGPKIDALGKNIKHVE
jgi:hypothetical protein